MSSLVSSFSFWDWSQIVGTLLVVIGVAGELVLLVKKFRYNPTNFPPVESLKRKLEILSVVILLVGLVLEVVALPHSLWETARLEQSNLELKNQMQVRIIGDKDAQKFIAVLKNSPKGLVRMGVLQNFSRKMGVYGNEIHDLLIEAHYSVPGKIEVLHTFIPPMNEPDSSIVVLIKSPDTRPAYADALAKAFTNVADKVSGASISEQQGDLVLNTNEVMIFISNFR